MPVSLIGNVLVSIDVVTLRRARLMPGWVTVLGRVNHLAPEPGTRTTQYAAKVGCTLFDILVDLIDANVHDIISLPMNTMAVAASHDKP